MVKVKGNDNGINKNTSWVITTFGEILTTVSKRHSKETVGDASVDVYYAGYIPKIEESTLREFRKDPQTGKYIAENGDELVFELNKEVIEYAKNIALTRLAHEVRAYDDYKEKYENTKKKIWSALSAHDAIEKHLLPYLTYLKQKEESAQ